LGAVEASLSPSSPRIPPRIAPSPVTEYEEEYEELPEDPFICMLCLFCLCVEPETFAILSGLKCDLCLCVYCHAGLFSYPS
jgi:hypothetical protein